MLVRKRPLAVRLPIVIQKILIARSTKKKCKERQESKSLLALFASLAAKLI
jgi:hypothetical protein